MISLVWLLMAATVSEARDQLQHAEIRGPPKATDKVVQQMLKITENIRLQCPIVGFPAPLYEWKKDGQSIDDITWTRYKKNKSWLKIRTAEMDDTGVYYCKAVNGFGSDDAKIELIIIDPGRAQNGLVGEMAPIFTAETRQAEKQHRLKVGDMFKVSCEALGVPRPVISWFKNGQEISGRSSVELRVLGTADAGVYTCRANNSVGLRELNFALSVKEQLEEVVVTPANSSITVGDTAVLKCRIKSASQSHTKWLKKLERPVKLLEDSKVVDVGNNEHYRVLDTDIDVSVGENEFLSSLVISDASEEHSGIYICFVTKNGGDGALNYKTAFISVLPNELPPKSLHHNLLLYLTVSGVCIIAFLSAMITVICVIRRSQRRPVNSNNALQQQQHRPFLTTNCKYDPAPISSAGQWSHTVYPTSRYENPPGKSGLQMVESATANHYEVPYSHLMAARSTSMMLSRPLRPQRVTVETIAGGGGGYLRDRDQQYLNDYVP